MSEIKLRQILGQYLLASFIPGLTTIVIGLMRMPKNCGQCIPLLIVGYGLLTMLLLILNLSLYLFLLNVKQALSSKITHIIASYAPSIILAWFLIRVYYDPNKKYNTDFDMSFPSVILLFIISSVIFYTNSLKKRN